MKGVLEEWESSGRDRRMKGMVDRMRWLKEIIGVLKG
jgi:hypothetical protein